MMTVLIFPCSLSNCTLNELQFTSVTLYLHLVRWPVRHRKFQNIIQHTLDHTLSRDGHETFQAETETRPETQRSETETLGILSETRPRRSSSRDLGRDVWWKKLSTTKSTELVNTLYLWCCEILLLVHYVHFAVLLQYVSQSLVRL